MQNKTFTNKCMFYVATVQDFMEFDLTSTKGFFHVTGAYDLSSLAQENAEMY